MPIKLFVTLLRILMILRLSDSQARAHRNTLTLTVAQQFKGVFMQKFSVNNFL